MSTLLAEGQSATPVRNAIELEGVDAHRRKTLALDAITLAIPRGSVAVVMGPNGAGKSTLFGLISGRIKASAGRVTVDGTVAEVMQSSSVDEQMPLTVEDVVRQGRYRDRGLLGRMTKSDRAIVDEALDAVGMSGHRATPIHALSGGQRQRAMVAQGVAQQAPILLLDEPTTGVDLPTQRDIDGLIRDVADRGTTVMFSTHNVDDAAKSDFMVALCCSCVCCEPTVKALNNPDVVELVAGPSRRPRG